MNFNVTSKEKRESIKNDYNIIAEEYSAELQYIIKADGDSAQNQYWLNEGIIGYSFSDDKKFSKILRRVIYE